MTNIWKARLCGLVLHLPGLLIRRTFKNADGYVTVEDFCPRCGAVLMRLSFDIPDEGP